MQKLSFIAMLIFGARSFQLNHNMNNKELKCHGDKKFSIRWLGLQHKG